MSQRIHPNGLTLIQRYEIKDFLAEGGMQQVYVAKDLSFDREVALKVPKNPSAEKRFARSARMSARINHANVAKTLDYFEAEGRSYLVEELIRGEDLNKGLDKTYEYLDPHMAAHLIHHLAKGVAAAHHRDVFHRDLKPHNIIVSADPKISIVKITDFGIAKMAEQEISDAFKDESSITGSQTVMGALPYMAPEMVETPKLATTPADIWAVGAILYRLLSGKPPFGSGLVAVPNIIQAKPPATPRYFGTKSQFDNLNESLWQIILACLQKDPKARPTADKLVSLCSELCYSHSPREAGTIVSFRDGTGAWGTIRSDAGASIFFHSHSFYGSTPSEGARVSFASFPGFPKPRAFPVLPLKA